MYENIKEPVPFSFHFILTVNRVKDNENTKSESALVILLHCLRYNIVHVSYGVAWHRLSRAIDFLSTYI